jgi:large subunit ribosomal protein L35
MTGTAMAKQKQKTHKGLRKRVKVTARGKVLRKMAFAGHLMSSKSGNRCRKLRHKVVMVSKIAENVKRALGYK